MARRGHFPTCRNSGLELGTRAGEVSLCRAEFDSVGRNAAAKSSSAINRLASRSSDGSSALLAEGIAFLPLDHFGSLNRRVMPRAEPWQNRGNLRLAIAVRDELGHEGRFAFQRQAVYGAVVGVGRHRLNPRVDVSTMNEG